MFEFGTHLCDSAELDWVPTGFQLGSNWVPAFFGWVPIGFQLGSNWVPKPPIGFQLGSNWVPIGFHLAFLHFWFLPSFWSFFLVLGSSILIYSSIFCKMFDSSRGKCHRCASESKMYVIHDEKPKQRVSERKPPLHFHFPHTGNSSENYRFQSDFAFL